MLNEQQQKLVEDNIKLVYEVLNRHYSHMPQNIQEDLEGEGKIALVKAAQLYKPDGGVKFVTYAYWAIKNNMARWNQLRHTQSRTKYTAISMEQEVPGGGGPEVTYESTLGEVDEGYEAVENAIMNEQRKDFVKRMFEALNKLEKNILFLKYYKGYSSKQIAKELEYGTDKTVNSRLYLIKLKLRQQFGDEYKKVFSI
jgi:RNA polymerase sigma factor (sigma-70 family)